MQESGASRPNRRQLQAAQTRRDILDAAIRLFAERGYARTSVADIARETGVAVQTIYGSVGQKHQIMNALVDDIDERAGVGELARQVPAQTDPLQVIRLAAQITRQLNERCADTLSSLQSAIAVEPELASAWNEGEARHKAGSLQAATRIAALCPDVDVDAAAAAIDALTATATYTRLHNDYGWSYDEIEDWIINALHRLLLPE